MFVNPSPLLTKSPPFSLNVFSGRAEGCIPFHTTGILELIFFNSLIVSVAIVILGVDDADGVDPSTDMHTKLGLKLFIFNAVVFESRSSASASKISTLYPLSLTYAATKAAQYGG